MIRSLVYNYNQILLMCGKDAASYSNIRLTTINEAKLTINLYNHHNNYNYCKKVALTK